MGFPVDVGFPVNVVLGLFAAAASAIAFLLWRGKVSLRTRLVALDSENERLRNVLSARKDQGNARILRLEHDLKSPLGVILGFSMLLREYVEEHPAGPPALPLRSINGIDQAARKMLRIVESASQSPPSDMRAEQAVIEERTRP